MKSEWCFIQYKPFQATEPHRGTEKCIFRNSTESLYFSPYRRRFLSWLVYMWGKWSPLNCRHGLHWITWLKFRFSLMFSFFPTVEVCWSGVALLLFPLKIDGVQIVGRIVSATVIFFESCVIKTHCFSFPWYLPTYFTQLLVRYLICFHKIINSSSRDCSTIGKEE